MSTDLQPCETARAKYAPGKQYRLSDYDRHVKSCAECTRFVRATRRSQRSTSKYSRDYPLTGDTHKYLLVVPRELWTAFDKRRGRDSARSTLNRLIDFYARHGMPVKS